MYEKYRGGENLGPKFNITLGKDFQEDGLPLEALSSKLLLPLQNLMDPQVTKSVAKRPSAIAIERTVINVESNPIFADLHSFHRLGAVTAANILNISEAVTSEQLL